MKQKQHRTEAIIRILRQAETDETNDSVCREHNVSKATFHRWKRKYGDMDVADARLLKELEKENAEFKKMLAEKSRTGRSQRKKVVSPMQKKQAVAHVVDQGLCSVRRACRYLDVYRSTYRYQAKPIPSKQRQLHQRPESPSQTPTNTASRRIDGLAYSGASPQPSMDLGFYFRSNG